MNRKSITKITKILSLRKDDLQERFKIKEIAVFGSYVKGKQNQKSDIDILVDFEHGYKTFDNYMELKFFLEEVLNTKVDLVLKTAIKEEIKSYILTEAVYV
ncbi:MAG: nucleotidyltransferase family protein [bacterium]|nr:nucleotidyltransferase family protein [bacterium]